MANDPVADLGERRTRVPLLVKFLFIFMQFLAKIMPNNRLAPPGNPGSATLIVGCQVDHLTISVSFPVDYTLYHNIANDIKSSAKIFKNPMGCPAVTGPIKQTAKGIKGLPQVTTATKCFI